MRIRGISFLVTSCIALGIAGAMCGAATGADYSDVPKWHWAWAYVQGVSDANVAGGYGDGRYQPQEVVSRAQMAVFVARAMCGGEEYVPDSDCTQPPFPDVACDYWARKHIVHCVGEEVVSGYETGLYEPEWEVTRGQMAAFIARAMCGGDQNVPEHAGAVTFPDVTSDNENAWCYHYVEYIAGQEVTLGYPDGRYYPKVACCRDQMAAYLCRAFELPMPAQPYNITEHFPLNEGNTWVYETPDGIHTESVSGTADVWGRVCARIVSTEDGAIEYWQAQPEGLHFAGFHEPEEGTVTFNPTLLIDNGLDTGAAGGRTSPAYLNSVTSLGDAEFTYNFEGVETVSVPAGTFEDCMRMQMRLELDGQEIDHFRMWFARGVGIVKYDNRDFGGEDWEVLLCADVGGVHYPLNEENLVVADYYPLEVGSTWIYGGSDGTEIDQVVGVDEVGDFETARIDSGPAIGTPDRKYYTLIDGALAHVGEYDGNGDDLITFSPPIAFPETVRMGDHASVTVEASVNGTPVPGSGTFQWAVVGGGPATVPAGTFENCVKLRVSLADPVGQEDEFYLWLALGVGPIIRDERPFGGSYWRQLDTADVCGVQYPTAGRTFNIEDYCNFTVGNVWAYEDGELERLVDGTHDEGGTWAAVMDSDGRTHYVRADGCGLYWLGLEDASIGSVRWNPPLYVPNGLTPGQDGSQMVDALVDGSSEGEASFSYAFEHIEATRVGAGLFRDCMRMELTLASPVTPTSTASVWFARATGPVRMEYDSGATLKLTSGEIDTRVYPAESATYNVTHYYHLTLADEWRRVYQGEWTGASNRYVADTLDLSGLGVSDTVYAVDIYEGDEYRGADLLGTTAEGFARYGFKESNGIAVVAVPPLLIPNSAVLGDSGSGDSSLYQGQPGDWQYVGEADGYWAVLDAGPITTDAGYFPDCLHIWWRAESSEGDVSAYEWLARGIGPVKVCETDEPRWGETMGAVIFGDRIPEQLPPATGWSARQIDESDTWGFDFSAGAMTADAGQQDLQYVYYGAGDARFESFQAEGVCRFIGHGEYDFNSYMRFATYLPPERDIWGEVWSEAVNVLDGGGWQDDKVLVAETREGNYVLVYITDVDATRASIHYVYPYSWYTW